MKPSIIRALAASALLLATASAASAQAAVQSGSAATAKLTPWAAVPAGSYKLNIQLPDHELPATLKITDSSGVAAGTFLPEGDSDAMPVKISVKGTELTVTGVAPKGPFAIVLTRQGTDLAGKWEYGGDTGKLTGKVE
jgi:hypothetical protein